MPQDTKNHIEMFIRCESLVLGSSRDSSVFVAVSTSEGVGKELEELIRTETICQGPSPKFCTSFVVPYDNAEVSQHAVFFDVYIRKSVTSERLSDQEHIGHVAVPLKRVLTATGNHSVAHLVAPSGDAAGRMTISAEPVDMRHPDARHTMELEVRAVALRKRDWARTFIPQRYELWRAHAHGDEQGATVWLPVHRSDRVSKTRDASQHIDFTTASLSYRHLCNGDDGRRLRLVLSSESAKTGTCDADIGFVDLTLRQLCEMDPAEDVFKIQREGVAQDVGHVRIMHAEPTDYGGSFSLLMNYRGCDLHSVANEGVIQKAMLSLKKPSLKTPRSIKGGKKKTTLAEHVAPATCSVLIFLTEYQPGDF